MSTPMHDVPDHFPLPVTEDRRGPAEGSDFHHWECWCGEDGCQKGFEDFDPYAKPSESISNVQYAFPADLGILLPPWDMIPDEFKSSRNEWNRFASKWFGDRFPDSGVVQREGIDPEKSYRHLMTILKSFEPKHEHKIAAVAWLASRWWSGIVTPEVKA